MDPIPTGGGRRVVEKGYRGGEEEENSLLALALEIKMVDDSSDVSVVTGFNTQLLRRKCLRSSDLYNSTIDLDQVGKELFISNQWWSSKKMLMQAVKDFGKLVGVKPTTNHNHV